MNYKYRIYPTKEQQNSLSSFCGAQRFIWNHFLAKEIEQYEEDKTFRFAHKNITSLPELKKRDELSWLNTIPSTSLQQTLKNLDRSLKQSFRKASNKKGFPKFKKKRFNNGSLRLVMVTEKLFDSERKTFKIPKIGKVKIKYHRKLPSDFKSCSIKQDAGKWFITFTVEVTKKEKVKHIKNISGLDFNSKDIVVDDKGQSFSNPKFFLKAKKRIAKENKSLANKKKGSNNWKRQLLRLQRAHSTVTEQRKNFLNKLSRQLIDENELVCLEDLNVKGMSRFNGSMVGDAGWSELRRMLTYKAELYGKHVEIIDRYFPSSKMCSNCGTLIDKKLSDRIHKCDCGFETTRDHNAAINIRHEGLDQFVTKNRAGTVRIYACGDTSIGDFDFGHYLDMYRGNMKHRKRQLRCSSR